MASHTTKQAVQPDTCKMTLINIDEHVFMHINRTFDDDDDDIMYSFMDTSGRQVKERWFKTES